MTEKFYGSKRELSLHDSHRFHQVGCCCFHDTCKEYLLKFENGVWFIELPHIFMKDTKWFEVALYSFCPNCGKFEYQTLPTSTETNVDNYIYVVNDKNRPILVTRSRNEANRKYVDVLKTFNNPFGETATKELTINMVEFY